MKTLWIVFFAAVFITNGCSSQELGAIAEGLNSAGASGGYSYQPDPITAASETNTEMFLNGMGNTSSYTGDQSNGGSNMDMSCAEWKSKNPNGGHGGAYCDSNIAD